MHRVQSLLKTSRISLEEVAEALFFFFFYFRWSLFFQALPLQNFSPGTFSLCWGHGGKFSSHDLQHLWCHRSSVCQVTESRHWPLIHCLISNRDWAIRTGFIFALCALQNSLISFHWLIGQSQTWDVILLLHKDSAIHFNNVADYLASRFGRNSLSVLITFYCFNLMVLCVSRQCVWNFSSSNIYSYSYYYKCACIVPALKFYLENFE